MTVVSACCNNNVQSTMMGEVFVNRKCFHTACVFNLDRAGRARHMSYPCQGLINVVRHYTLRICIQSLMYLGQHRR